MRRATVHSARARTDDAGTSRSEQSARSVALVDRAIATVRAGQMVILTDDEDRENEGDLVMAAQKVTPAAVNFMATHGRGLICLSVTEERARRLNLPLMVQDNASQFKTAFTVSIEAARGVSTGISARDRATTIKVAVAPGARPGHLVRPGHVFPLIARDGGVLVRTGQTEGSVDLARLAGLTPAGVICEIMNPDGTMARRPELSRFARRHSLVLLSVADLVRYRLEHEQLVTRTEEVVLPLAAVGSFTAVRYESVVDGQKHVALVCGSVNGGAPLLVRVHASCLLGDTLGSGGCDCGPQLRKSLAQIAREGRGVLVYLHKGTPARLACTHLQLDEPRLRELGVGAQILRELGVRRIRLLTNNPKKIVGLEGFGLSVVERVPIEGDETPDNREYLKRKRAQGHLLSASR